MDPSNSSGSSGASIERQEEDPGAYPIPFSTNNVKIGTRLDVISASLRYWAVNPERARAHWYNDVVEANNRYEEWLTTRPPGEYPVPFGEAKRLDELEDGSRYWAIHPDRSTSPWYDFFVKANERYEQHLAATREPGKFPFPHGNNKEYTSMPIKDVPQDTIWWALRPSNRHLGWYKPLYDANKRMLDDIYKSRSPGSEPIWFGERYRGLRLDQVYERKGFMQWCNDPERGEPAWLNRFRDLVDRLKEWRQMHPERSNPGHQRRASVTQNPVGEAIGPWDDSPGSADEDDYDKDSFIQSDSDELEYATADDDFGGSDDDDGSTSSSVEMRPSAIRRRTNMIPSDASGDQSEEGEVSIAKLGKRYRTRYESSEEE